MYKLNKRGPKTEPFGTPAAAKTTRRKSFGHLSSPSRKTRLGSLLSENLIRLLSAIDNLSQLSHANLIPKSPQKALAVSPTFVKSQLVLKLLNNLNIHKASRPGGLSARLIKECSSEISLALIYNESLDQGTVPDHWR